MGGKGRKKKVYRIQPTIWSASRDGNVADLTNILAAGGDPNEIDNLGWAPLHYACLEGRREAVEFLLENGAEVNKITEGILTERGGPSTSKYEIQYLGCTPIHIAVRKGFNAIVSELIRHGADPTIFDLIGQTAIQYANPKTRSILNFEMAINQPNGEAPKEEEEDLAENAEPAN